MRPKLLHPPPGALQGGANRSTSNFVLDQTTAHTGMYCKDCLWIKTNISDFSGLFNFLCFLRFSVFSGARNGLFLDPSSPVRRESFI